MKIFQLNASYKPAYIYGGPTMSVSKLSEEISKQGNPIEVVTTSANGPGELEVELGKSVLVDGVKVTYYPRITKDHTHFSPQLLSALARKLKLSKVSNESPVVHVHAWWNLVSMFSSWIARWKNIPVILSPRGTLSGYSFTNRNSGLKDYLHRFLGKGLLEYSYFHVTSEKEKRDIERLVKPKGVFVIPNFVRIPELTPHPSPSDSSEQVLLKEREKTTPHPDPSDQSEQVLLKEREKNTLRLLFISRVEEKKGLELLFESLKEFKANWTLDIAGSGEEVYVSKLKSFTEELGISGGINWLGHVNNEQKFDVMADHDVMVLPSFDENFANVVIECLSVGTSVLLTRNVGLADYVEAKELGWVCERTKDDLLSQLFKISSSREKIEEIRANAPLIIRKDFNEEKLVKQYIAMYEEVLRQSK
ncbi:XrtY-associated glycosyltransferase XYAG1 [Desertivirga brevis]|uniref:XrtY-associated glycosyltransferase XYAG1 n=1 Tax=Desertivirga brevis TaxID=2810310 RepID=UPI001A964D18|nr:glycosyltransferase [Pedobacter sp. SYSU D00873]